jgi:tRNA guanosine-2'-O-methyltransferase
MVPNLQVAQTWAFRQVAASAHRWQDLQACAPDQLSAWVRNQRSQGFTVFALTRSPAALPLPQVQFPPRTVLLLGRELTGIPAPVRAACDGAIAIPQWGQVESFNVHTAAAIAAYGYRIQYPDGSSG